MCITFDCISFRRLSLCCWWKRSGPDSHRGNQSQSSVWRKDLHSLQQQQQQQQQHPVWWSLLVVVSFASVGFFPFCFLFATRTVQRFGLSEWEPDFVKSYGVEKKRQWNELLLGFTGFGSVLASCTSFFLFGFLPDFLLVLLGFTGLYWVFSWFDWVWSGFIGFYLVWLGLIGFTLGLTGFCSVLLGFTGFY